MSKTKSKTKGRLFSLTTILMFSFVIALSVLTVFLNLYNSNDTKPQNSQNDEGIINNLNRDEVNFENFENLENYTQYELLIKNLPFENDTFTVSLISFEDEQKPKLLVKTITLSGKSDFSRWLKAFGLTENDVEAIYSSSPDSSFEGAYDAENI
ncbi:MAG: hypothetical protein KatS3mg085_096 [Candidatus Dojkabacteria bacterium]|nr:MAG: hypothetical protein KatS3mg085_096 [Candidatus Dojkabacteria bacterium]